MMAAASRVVAICYTASGAAAIMDQKIQTSSDSRTTLAAEIAAYRHESARLETDHMGKWVVFKGPDLIAIHETFEAAAEDAVERFGRGPFLIRQVGAPP